VGLRGRKEESVSCCKVEEWKWEGKLQKKKVLKVMTRCVVA